MALNDVALASRALMRIGAAPITSFDDGSVESQVAEALYGPARDAILSAYGWSFATGQVELVRLQDAPIADYNYAYQLPNDFLRALSAGVGVRGRGQNYRIANGRLYADSSSLILTYVYRPEEETFPPYFDQVVISRLAAEFTIPITESTSRAEAMFNMADREFKRARQIDAQQDTPAALENFPLIDVRG